MDQRFETDSLGRVAVPATAYYGAQTARAVANFPIGGQRFPRPFIAALGRIKEAAAAVNAELGVLDARRAGYIRRAAAEVVAGSLDAEFVVPIWQTGSGTQVNMNANEVIAGRANEMADAGRGGKSPVHPNDHVNRSQSSNDVVPTAMHLALGDEIQNRLLPALDVLAGALAERAKAFADIVKIGRTHLMDAVPLTLGQEFSGWAAQVEAARARIVAAVPGLCELALGGTAVGTGLNAPEGFATRVLARLEQSTGLPLRRARNAFAAQGGHDAVVAASGALRDAAVALAKVANDIRLLGSGPRCGLGELRLPAREPGSSIMPGKVNPTQAEALSMVCARVMGNDVAVGFGGAHGHLELNAYKPLLIHCTLESVELLADASRSFAERCVTGIEADRAGIERHLERSLMLVTNLTPVIGYDAAAKAAKKALEEGLTLREAVLALELMDADALDAHLRPEDMTDGRW